MPQPVWVMTNSFIKMQILTLLVYDKEGNYLETRTADRPETADENWRMVIDLPAGDYNMLAFGGMECRDASFRFSAPVNETPMQDLQVVLPLSYPPFHKFQIPVF